MTHNRLCADADAWKWSAVTYKLPKLPLRLRNQLLLTLATRFSLANASDERIAYGYDASPGQFPFMASVQVKDTPSADWRHACGGTLVAKNMVLTAAHCLFDPGSGNLRKALAVVMSGRSLQDPNADVLTVTRTLRPKGYNNSMWSTGTPPWGDLALLVLNDTSSQAPVAVANNMPADGGISLIGQYLTAVGWGRVEDGTSPAKLQYTNLTISPLVKCGLTDPDTAIGMMCTTAAPVANGQYPSTCPGDSGGPFLAIALQVGVSSFGSAGSCGSISYNGMTFLPYFYSKFIQPNIDKYGSK